MKYKEPGLPRDFYVYIATNRSRALYTGFTKNIERRLREHKRRAGSRFAARYNITQLAYYEVFSNKRDAIAREKRIKGWRRDRKIALIESVNPEWRDL